MTPSTTVPFLNMVLEQWRVFGKEYTSGKLGDVSDANIPASPAVDQMVDKVAISPNELLPMDVNNSMLEVVGGNIIPVGMDFNSINPGYVGTRMPNSANNVTVAYEPLAYDGATPYYSYETALPATSAQVPDENKATLLEGWEISNSNMKVVNTNSNLYPFSVSWNFYDIDGYDDMPVMFVFLRVSLRVLTPATQLPTGNRISAGGLQMGAITKWDFGGGMYTNLFDRTISKPSQWTPLYISSCTSGRTFAVPINPAGQKNIKVMFRNCYNWSVEFMGYTVGG